MRVSDKIEAFILELMNQQKEEWLEIQRGELADLFDCVPSQITYVLATRFGENSGFAVESRRGGGGCVRIKRIEKQPETEGDGFSEDYAGEYIGVLEKSGYISTETAKILSAAVSNDALRSVENPNRVRKNIIEHIRRNCL